MPFENGETVLMKIFAIIIGVIFCFTAQSQKYQTHFSDLDYAISHSPQYDNAKEKVINGLKRNLKKQGDSSLNLIDSIYEAYKVYNYDSAYLYAKRALSLSIEKKDSTEIAAAKIKIGFITLSSGLFKEAFDSLHTISPGKLTSANKFQYYYLMARAYYDLADYTADNFHSPQYDSLGNVFLETALQSGAQLFDQLYLNGLKNIRSKKMDTAMFYLKRSLAAPNLSLHQQALATSTLSDIYIRKGAIDSAVTLLKTAAICDIQSSTKETSAMFNLANLLFKAGDVKNASSFIEKAVSDAVFYGARQRKVQLSTILPLIEGEKVARVEHEKQILLFYLLVLAVFFISLVYLIALVSRQNKKLKNAQIEITKAHMEQREINSKLIEANTIKEHYIAFFFKSQTAIFNKIDWFKNKAEKKIYDRKPHEEISLLLSSLNIKQEREDLQKNFDEIFLKIFPNFIEGYNKLFREEDQVVLKENELLNTDLRIFALIRLGITDNDKIASILGYSLNTINSYKTKIKNKAIVPNEQFEDRIMDIKSL